MKRLYMALAVATLATMSFAQPLSVDEGQAYGQADGHCHVASRQ